MNRDNFISPILIWMLSLPSLLSSLLPPYFTTWNSNTMSFRNGESNSIFALSSDLRGKLSLFHQQVCWSLWVLVPHEVKEILFLVFWEASTWTGVAVSQILDCICWDDRVVSLLWSADREARWLPNLSKPSGHEPPLVLFSVTRWYQWYRSRIFVSLVLLS